MRTLAVVLSRDAVVFSLWLLQKMSILIPHDAQPHVTLQFFSYLHFDARLGDVYRHGTTKIFQRTISSGGDKIYLIVTLCLQPPTSQTLRYSSLR